MDFIASLTALLPTWTTQAWSAALAVVAGLLGFAIGYAVTKGALRFVLKRLHIIG